MFLIKDYSDGYYELLSSVRTEPLCVQKEELLKIAKNAKVMGVSRFGIIIPTSRSKHGILETFHFEIQDAVPCLQEVVKDFDGGKFKVLVRFQQTSSIFVDFEVWYEYEDQKVLLDISGDIPEKLKFYTINFATYLLKYNEYVSDHDKARKLASKLGIVRYKVTGRKLAFNVSYPRTENCSSYTMSYGVDINTEKIVSVSLFSGYDVDAEENYKRSVFV